MNDKLLPRDLALLRHVGLYRVGVYPVMSELLFSGNGTSCGVAVKRLAEERDGRLPLVDLHRRALPGKLSYVTMRPAGCRLLGLSPRRATTLGTSALDLAIALSYFCHRGEERRHRVERAELSQLLGDDAPPDNIPHVATAELGWPCVLRVYQVGRNIESAIRQIRRDIFEAERRPILGNWLSAGDYGFAILVPWPDKLGMVRRAFDRARLIEDVPIVVGTGPTAETLAAALKHEG